MSQDVVRCFQSPRPLTPHVSRSDSNVTCTCSPAPMSAGAVGQRKAKGHEEGGPSISETGSRPQHPRPKPGRPRPTQEPGEGVICPPPHVTGDESRRNSRSSAQNGAPLGIRRSRHRHLPREFETLSVPDPVGLQSVGSRLGIATNPPRRFWGPTRWSETFTVPATGTRRGNAAGWDDLSQVHHSGAAWRGPRSLPTASPHFLMRTISQAPVTLAKRMNE